MGIFSRLFGNQNRLLAWQKLVMPNSPDRLVFNEQQLAQWTAVITEQDFKIINDCLKIIQETVKPDVFFTRLELLKEKIAHLQMFEPYVKFQNVNPTQLSDTVRQKEQETISSFLDRYLDAVCRKANDMKSAKGKKNQYEKFYSSLQEYYPLMNDENIQYIEEQYQFYATDGTSEELCETYRQLLRNCQSLHTDLVEATSHGYTCALCSSLEGRIFSISGRDKRFPKLPDEVKIYGGFHEGCRHGFSLFIYGIYTMTNGQDPIEFSNRPYMDYRTPEQKEVYEAEVAKAEALAKARAEYEWICANLPDIAPKSLSGYSRMKNGNTANFQKLVEAAKSKGYTIS